jgi:hypothetical protein
MIRIRIGSDAEIIHTTFIPTYHADGPVFSVWESLELSYLYSVSAVDKLQNRWQ